MLSADENLEIIKAKFEKMFGDQIKLIKAASAQHYMGWFSVEYFYIPQKLKIVFENDRLLFTLDITDSEGAHGTLPYQNEFDNCLCEENVNAALCVLKQKVEQPESLIMHLKKGRKWYRKFKGVYTKVLDFVKEYENRMEIK